jgi:hypothetical protein
MIGENEIKSEERATRTKSAKQLGGNYRLFSVSRYCVLTGLMPDSGGFRESGSFLFKSNFTLSQNFL